MPTLTVLMGAPGSGKTTWARSHASGALVASTDPLRTEAHLREPGAVAAFQRRLEGKAERSLCRGVDVLVDACNVHAHERSRWRGLARRTYARARLVVCHAPVETLLAVQEGRDRGVPRERVYAYVREFNAAQRVINAEQWVSIEHVHRDARIRSVSSR